LSHSYSPQQNNPRRVVTQSGSSICQSTTWYHHPQCQPFFDGAFNPEKDLIRSGSRTEISTEFFRTFEFEFITWKSLFQIKNQNYSFPINNLPDANRFQTKVDLSLNSEGYRVFNQKIKHVIQPSLRFVTTPLIHETPHPFFGDSSRTPYSPNANVSDQDLNAPWGLHFDYYDRVFDRKVVSAELINRWIEKIYDENNNPSYVTRVHWRLSQGYDFYQTEIELPNRQPLSELASDLHINLDRLQIYQRSTYFPYHHVTNSSTRVRYQTTMGDYLDLGYLRAYSVTPGESVIADQRIEDGIVEFKKAFPYFSIIARGTYDLNPHSPTAYSFKSAGFSSQFRLPGNCWYLTLTHYRLPRGDGITLINFDFLWDPKQKPPLPENFLAQIGF
ncbi:MAG: hypothetical protein NZ480_09760, partial [Bdellovibrionaceae bacterium]|nr:hypothetical protein [Pseudobdellovibrionaceae bacterium]MDW8191103.1 hypothetical protein [Pseudobdellovibrionaceae bacterium]